MCFLQRVCVSLARVFILRLHRREQTQRRKSLRRVAAGGRRVRVRADTRIHHESVRGWGGGGGGAIGRDSPRFGCPPCHGRRRSRSLFLLFQLFFQQAGNKEEAAAAGVAAAAGGAGDGGGGSNKRNRPP